MITVEAALEPALLRRFLELVREHTGITMEERKGAMLETRLRKRMRALGLGLYRDYLNLLEGRGAEVQEFINLATTNETFFFRTTAVWDYFEKQFLPAWKGRESKRPLRLWSAAASCGAEAYSLAMACEEARVEYEILGTDISTAILEEARLGAYDGRVAADLQAKRPAYRAKYFDGKGGLLQVRPLLQKRVEFKAHNLFLPAPVSQPFDFVFLRNVLIYFSEPDQETVLRRMAAALRPEGLLALGESESLSRLDAPFSFVAPLIYRKEEKS
jgi:chemotaxis protein methyltransferase CheR